MTTDKIQPPTVIFISIFPFLSSFFIYTCARYLVTICVCIVKCLYDDELLCSNLKKRLSITALFLYGTHNKDNHGS